MIPDISKSPLGPHRRLFLLLQWRLASMRLQEARRPRFCLECGGELAQPRYTGRRRCDPCLQSRRDDEHERLQEMQLRDLERDQLFDGPMRRKISLDHYDR